jgi:uncharacterized membrane protein YphA (DoxX/SURF4 family)
MKPYSNTNKWYWVTTVLFALFLLGDAYGGITKQQAGVDVLNHLGYPLYLLVVVGVAKLFCAAAILQTRFITIKEWAFACFGAICFLAFASRASVGDTGLDLMFPIIFFGIMLIPYYFWKRNLAIH